MSSPTANGPQTVEARQQERVDVYSTYVAVAPIELEGARAFNKGDAVPAGHIERGVVREDQVAKTSTKAGRQAAGTSEKKG